MKDSINFDILLFVVFLILKTTGTVNWSWWLVFLPLYFFPAVIIIVGLFIVGALLIDKIFG